MTDELPTTKAPVSYEELVAQVEDLKKQVEEQAKDLYAMFEHIHAMTAEAGGIKTRWDKHLQPRYAIYIDRKRLFEPKKVFLPE